jgi:hypothetical protein
VFENLVAYSPVFGCAIAFLGLLWKVAVKVIDRYDDTKKRIADREYEDQLKLEQERVLLQKELEHQKGITIQTHIDGVKEEIRKIDKKVDTLTQSFYEMKSKVDTNQAEVKKIGEDLLLIKTATDRIRK